MAKISCSTFLLLVMLAHFGDLNTVITSATSTTSTTSFSPTGGVSRNTSGDSSDISFQGLNGHDEHRPIPGTETGTEPEPIHKLSDSKNNGGKNLNNLNSLVTLDLAGRFDVHLSSPSIIVEDDNDANLINTSYNNNSNKRVHNNDAGGHLYNTTPLFHWGKVSHLQRTPPAPHVHVGGHYNFKAVWYGLTRIMTTMSWGNVNSYNSHVSSHQQNQHNRQTLSAKISAEKGLLSPKDYAMDLGFALPTNKSIFHSQSQIQNQSNNVKQRHQPTSVVLRCQTRDRNHQNHMTASLTAKTSLLHPRIQLIGKSIVKIGKNLNGGRLPFSMLPKATTSSTSLSSSPFLSRIQQQKLKLSDESSWLPDIKMTPGGKVISNSSFGISTPTKYQKESDGDDNCSNRLGLRLTVRKQINWNILGSIFQQSSGNGGIHNSMSYDDENNESMNDTTVRLEVCGLTGVNSYTSVSAEAALERIYDTFHCTLLQEGIIN